MRTILLCTALLSTLCVTMNPLEARGTGNAKAKRTVHVATVGQYAPMDINYLFNYYGNSGDGSFNPYSTTEEGFEFPIGSNAGTTVFEDGLVWTAFKNGTLYCGGSTYNHGLQPGMILQGGTSTTKPVADDPAKAEYRVYRVRPDIKPTVNPDSVTIETNVLEGEEFPYISRFEAETADSLLHQYWNDWNEWPANEGAPFKDVNHDGKYEPGIDIPGYPGADQTEWMVMNDMDSSLTQGLYGSYPIGLEVQRTIWAYHNKPTPLDEAIFISYKIINKSGMRLDTMYISQWVDPDVGYAADDAAGCDTTRDLGFAYNGEASDLNYSKLGLVPPAIGFDLIEGPIVPASSEDTAVFDTRKIPGHANLPMTAFVVFVNTPNNLYFIDPQLGNAAGTWQWYDMMRGLAWSTGQPLINPQDTKPSRFWFPGDPVSDTGWTYLNDGRLKPADIRMALCSGPFTMEPGDTQQVVIAAVAGMGNDYLSSIYKLEANIDSIKNAYFQVSPKGTTGVLSSSSLPNNVQLYQNYPKGYVPKDAELEA